LADDGGVGVCGILPAGLWMAALLPLETLLLSGFCCQSIKE
jgi:hypothetical protein